MCLKSGKLPWGSHCEQTYQDALLKKRNRPSYDYIKGGGLKMTDALYRIKMKRMPPEALAEKIYNDHAVMKYKFDKKVSRVEKCPG